MRPLLRCTVAAALGLFAAAAIAASSEFEANLTLARENLGTATGAAYDVALGTSIQANPSFAQRMDACMEKYPNRHAMHGYFHFTTATRYEVVLEPSSEFSDCVSSALEGFEVPAPPSLPYFNNFTFSISE